ncbi:MAG: hypothetical protein RL676_639 [Pseudomonadota bacterium]
MKPLYTVRNLVIDLPAWGDRRHAVKDVNLELFPNEILCIVGESGSGKSVLARSLMGLFPSRHVRASQGEILLDGKDVLTMTPEELRSIRGDTVAMIFQEPMTALNPLLTIGEQSVEVIEVHRPELQKEARQRVIDVLADVHLPNPEQIFHAYPHQLSGGQRQRAMIAMALVLEPKCLIADEPTTALDVTTQAQILKLIKELQHKHHTAVVFITHDFGVVAEIADRIAVMESGQVVEVNQAEVLLTSPQHPYTKTLLDAVPSIYPAKTRDRTAAGPIALAVKDVSKVFSTKRGLFKGSAREVRALSGVSFDLKEGETLGVVGESGSGKSTLAKCIARLVDADDGQILISGQDFLSAKGEALRKFRRNVQLVFQDPYSSLDPRQKVGSIIAEGPILHGEDRDVAMQRMFELLQTVGLDKKAADRFPHEFSGGQRQRIGIARALALQPRLLIADEAVSALDVSVQAQVLRLLKEIRDQFKLTLLFITHDLRVAAQICDSIMVMSKGQAVEYGPTQKIFDAPEHPYTRELFGAVPGRAFWLKHQKAAQS